MTRTQGSSPHISQDTAVIDDGNSSAGAPELPSNQSAVTAQQATESLAYSLAPVPQSDSMLQMDLSPTQFESSAQMMMSSTDHYQETHDATSLCSSFPANHSMINWLGFEDGSGLIGSLNQDWQYPDHVFNFYMPASDAYSISQVSPAASKDIEAVIGARATHENFAETIPQDAGTTSTFRTDETVITPGQYYADGGTARLPRMRKRRAMSSYAVHKHSKKEFWMLVPTELTFPPSDVEWLDAQGYAELRSHYSNLCISGAAVFVPFEAAELPEKAFFDYLCDLYMENCSTVLPFLHTPTLRLKKQHPLLILAMAAVGSHYLKDQNANCFVLSMHEFIRRVLFCVTASIDALTMDASTHYRVAFLHAVGATYCGDEVLREHTLDFKFSLASFFFSTTQSQAKTVRTGSDWCQWVEQESSLRLRQCTWLLDSLWSFQLQTRTMFSLNDATFTLPVNEKLWNATSSSQWMQLKHSSENSLDLVTSVDELYISKKVMVDAGEFARILMIYGLHRRLSEVATYHSQRLSHWNSKDQSSSQTTVIPDLPIWLPSVPVFRQWQNLTCDSLDVLHWAANATIGEASGFEHPTVLHLHLARVVLLTPIREIVNLARYLAGDRGAKSEAEVMVDRQAVHRWALQHQYKARLAAIHAGVVFWHIRRFSANAFYEPTAVAHAALVLWAFSAFSSKTATLSSLLGVDGVRDATRADTDPDADCNSSDSESSSDTIILLDRPADDEIVQEFVLNGPRMRANMTGVGDLYGEKGPERVVREGTKILKTLGCWRVWETWAKVLDRLVVVCKRERKRVKDVAASNNNATSASSTRDIPAEEN
ncbi:hypothetical protein QM012_000773 [Aureobasidium pullulans]|uniref:Xylanolytic transcriptional activator regulatory domain-containing protein n=1 Tax=Aureobasidium pullulans TaxID=5580 RepID=A0ABR0TXX5_AURPU